MTNKLRTVVENLPGHWYKGGLQDDNGNYCAVGHLYQAFGASKDCAFEDGQDIDGFHNIWVFVEKVLEEFSDGQYADLPFFNDADETTEEDVIALFEKAAIRWDEQANLTD